MGSGKPYDAGGLLTPRSFRKYSAPKTIRTCINAARWQDGAGWVTQVADMTTNCFDAKQISYQP
jgi:hypothetical protein